MNAVAFWGLLIILLIARETNETMSNVTAMDERESVEGESVEGLIPG